MQRDQRLRRRREFDAVFRDGIGLVRGVLAVRIRDRHDDQPGRFGFAVSSRLGGAVVRNRIKRRLRESARRIDAAGLDIVVIARNGAERASFAVLDGSLIEAMREAMRQSMRRRGGAGGRQP